SAGPRALRHEKVAHAGWQGGFDDVAVAPVVGHVGVVEPRLPAGLQRIIGDALDERAAPGRFAGDVAVVGGVDRGHAHVGGAEDVNALMGVGGGVGAARVGVEQADEAVGGGDEGRTGAGFALDGD